MWIPLRAFPALFLAFAAVSAAARANVSDGVHPDFDLKEIRMPATFKTMGLGFLSDGTMVLGTTDVVGGGEIPAPDLNHKVYLVSGASTDSPADLKINRRLILKWPDENHWKNGLSWHQWVFTPLYLNGHFYAPYFVDLHAHPQGPVLWPPPDPQGLRQPG